MYYIDKTAAVTLVFMVSVQIHQMDTIACAMRDFPDLHVLKVGINNDLRFHVNMKKRCRKIPTVYLKLDI